MSSIATHAGLVNSVAFLVQSFVDRLESSHELGVSTGQNNYSTNYFQNSLKIIVGSTDGIKSVFTDYVGPLNTEIAFLSNFPAESKLNGTTSTQFVEKFRACAGVGCSFGSYLQDFGKFIDSAEYIPMAKYFAIKSGTGTRPGFISDVNYELSGGPVPEAGAFCDIQFDGDGILLRARGAELQPVTVPVPLRMSKLYYNSVSVASSNVGFGHDSAGNAALNFDIVGGLQPITQVGTIDFSTPMMITGKASDTCLKFRGTFVNARGNQLWAGISVEGEFDGTPYLLAKNALRCRKDNNEDYAQIAQVWSYMISIDPTLTEVARAALGPRVTW